MSKPEFIPMHVSKYAAIAIAALVGPLTALLIYLVNHSQFKPVWFHLVGICILLSSFVTVKAFPFTSARPQRMLLRFYLCLCLIFELVAFDVYEQRIPVVGDVILIGSIAMLVYCGYRPGMSVFQHRDANEAAREKK